MGEGFRANLLSRYGRLSSTAHTNGQSQVFELLKSLEPALPALSTANWQSTIRNYAAVLPDYADIQPAQGREASDITYHDTEGAFTRLLINRGYLGSRWEARTPTYFVQVKTTTGPCNTPFYMSKSQYKRVITPYS